MILAFNKKFVPKILDGTKIHTIRQDKPNRWKSGNQIHYATGVRTPNYECFKESECKSVQTIEIIRTGDYINETIIKIDSRVLSFEEKQQLAWSDGFENLLCFLLWFDQGFKGKIIHWTEKRY